MSFRPNMIGITILSNDPSGGTKAIYCPPTIYRPNVSNTSVCPPYGSLAGTAAKCYIPRRYRHLLGPSPSCNFPDQSVARAYSFSPSYWRSGYQPCNYGYLVNSNQGYYDPCAYGYLSRGVQRSSDPYGLEYLYSYRRRYCDPCDYSYSPSYGRRYCEPCDYSYSPSYGRRYYDPCVYSYPSSYGRSCYPSRGYTYRCGYSNDPCGYSSAPGSCQPRYADRRRYSCRAVSSDPYGFSSESPYSSGCRRRSSDCCNSCGPY